MCVRVCMCARAHTCAQGWNQWLWRPQGGIRAFGLKLWVTVSNLTWVLRGELGSSARAESTLSRWAILQPPKLFFLFISLYILILIDNSFYPCTYILNLALAFLIHVHYDVWLWKSTLDFTMNLPWLFEIMYPRDLCLPRHRFTVVFLPWDMIVCFLNSARIISPFSFDGYFICFQSLATRNRGQSVKYHMHRCILIFIRCGYCAVSNVCIR